MKTILKTSLLVLSLTVFLQNCNSPSTAGNASAMDGTRGGGDPNKIDQAAVELLLQGNGLKVAMVNYLNVIPVDQVQDAQVKATLTRLMNNSALVNDINTIAKTPIRILFLHRLLLETSAGKFVSIRRKSQLTFRVSGKKME